MATTYLDRFDQAEGFNGKIAVAIDLANALSTNLNAAADATDEEVRDRTADAALIVAHDLTEMIEALPVGPGYTWGSEAWFGTPEGFSEWED